MNELTKLQLKVLKLALKRYKRNLKNSSKSKVVTNDEISRICKLEVGSDVPTQLCRYLIHEQTNVVHGVVQYSDNYYINDSGIATVESKLQESRRHWIPAIVADVLSTIAIIISIIALLQ